MINDIYNIPQNNYEIILNYFESTHKKVSEFLNNIKKFKDITNDYCSKVKILFTEVHDINNNRLTSINTIITDKNNNINDKENDKKADINEDNKNLSSIDYNVSKINKFMTEFIQSFEDFLESIEKPLESYNRSIEIYNEEISSIKFIHEEEKKVFHFKYNKIESVNKELHGLYSEIEKNLVNYCLTRKKKKNKYKLDENILTLISKNVQNENEILEKYKKLDINIGKKFYNLTKIKANNIKEFIPELFKKSEIFINEFFDCFNKSYLIKVNQIKNIQNDQDIGKELILNMKTKIDEFNKLLQNNIDENNMIINLKEYSIKVIEDNEDLNNQKWDELSNRDICFIVKTMYNNFKKINKSKYNVEFEEKHINLKTIIDKLFSYGYLKNNNLEKKNDNNHNEFWKSLNMDVKEFTKMLTKERKEVNRTDIEEKIKPKEIDYLCNLMEIQEHREYFLLRLNNFRTLGEYNMPLDIFDYIAKAFLSISKQIYNENEKDENKLDFKSAQLLIILSQTFYCMKNEEKIYIYNELNKEELFHKEEFWNLIIKLRIDSEIEIVKKNEKKDILSKDLETSVAFSQLISLVTAINDFGNNKDYVKNIIMPFVNQYNIDENNLEIINNLIQNQK